MGTEKSEDGPGPERQVVEVPAARAVILRVVEATGSRAVEAGAVHEVFRGDGEAAPELRDVQVVGVFHLPPSSRRRRRNNILRYKYKGTTSIVFNIIVYTCRRES